MALERGHRRKEGPASVATQPQMDPPRGLSYTLVTARLLIVALGRYRLMHSTAPPDMHSGMFLVEPPVPVGTEFANARSIGR